MALVRQPQYDVQYDGENGTEKVEAFVDTSTGQIFNNQRQGDSENGFTYRMTPTDSSWDYMNTADPSGKNIFGSSGYVPDEYKLSGDESGDSWGSSNVGGTTPSGDFQIGQSLDRKGYTDVLNKYGITPRYDPEYGYVLPANVHNAITQEYFKNSGLGSYGDGGGFINKMLDAGVPLKLAMGAIAGPAIGALSDAAVSGLGLADAAGSLNTALGTALEGTGLSPDVIKGITNAAGTAGKNALTSGLNAAMSGKDPLEAAITGGAFSMLGGGIANSLVAEGINPTLANTISKAVVEEVRTGSINPEALLAGAVSGEANKALSGVLKDFDIPASMMPTITQAVNQVITTGEVDPQKLFSSTVLGQINSGSKTATEAGSGVTTPNETAAATVAAEPPPTNVSTNTADTNAVAGTDATTPTATEQAAATVAAETPLTPAPDQGEVPQPPVYVPPVEEAPATTEAPVKTDDEIKTEIAATQPITNADINADKVAAIESGVTDVKPVEKTPEEIAAELTVEPVKTEAPVTPAPIIITHDDGTTTSTDPVTNETTVVSTPDTGTTAETDITIAPDQGGVPTPPPVVIDNGDGTSTYVDPDTNQPVVVNNPVEPVVEEKKEEEEPRPLPLPEKEEEEPRPLPLPEEDDDDDDDDDDEVEPRPLPLPEKEEEEPRPSPPPDQPPLPEVVVTPEEEEPTPPPEDDFEPYEPLPVEPVEPEGCQLPFVDDGTGRCILPEDKVKEDNPIPDCGPGMVWSLTDNACVAIEDVTKPVVTPITPKPPVQPPVTPPKPPTPPVKPAVDPAQTKQNQQNALLMGLLLGQQQQAPQQQQPASLVKIDKPFDWNQDILGGADYLKATQQPYAAGGSVHSINEELLKMLRS